MRFAQSLLMICVTVLLARPPGPSGPTAHVNDVAGDKPTIELVFVIDTTGSMGGLIEVAKQKVWGIVNDVMNHPRSLWSGWAWSPIAITAMPMSRVTPVTRDLDNVYNTLMAYKAEGGGDGPEDVRQALADGVHKVGWSPRSPTSPRSSFWSGTRRPTMTMATSLTQSPRRWKP